MDKKKKNAWIISGLLLLCAGIFLIMILDDEHSEEAVKEISLRANTEDISINDMINNNEIKRPVSASAKDTYIDSYSNYSPTSSDVGDPEAIARVQDLIRENERNMKAGVIDIEKERNGITVSSENSEDPLPSSSTSLVTRVKPQKGDGQATVDTVAQATEIKEQASQKRSPFNTVSFGGRSSKNAIKAYVHSEQTVSDGYALKMRIAEDCYTDDGVFVPKNSLVHGIVRMADERVMVDIQSININGNILPFKKDVYSKDAIKGIAAPGNAKAEANKDIVGGALDGMPSSVPGLDAATQIAGAVASSAVSAGKQAVSKHVKKEKITIKTNYEIYLRPQD